MSELDIEALKRRLIADRSHGRLKAMVVSFEEMDAIIAALEDRERLRVAAWDVLNNTGTGDRALMRRRLIAALERSDG